MIRYAEINNENICYAVSDVSVPVSKPTLIRVTGFPTDYLGKRWNGSKWEAVESTPELVSPELVSYTASELMAAYHEGVESIG